MDTNDNRVSAAELRVRGIPVPAHIPDCATISRSAMNVVAATPIAQKDPTVLSLDLEITFTESFEWVEVVATVCRQATPPPTE